MSRVARRRNSISSIFLCEEEEAEGSLSCMSSSMLSATVPGEKRERRSVVSPVTCKGRSRANESALRGITAIQGWTGCMGDWKRFMVAFSHRLFVSVTSDRARVYGTQEGNRGSGGLQLITFRQSDSFILLSEVRKEAETLLLS